MLLKEQPAATSSLLGLNNPMLFFLEGPYTPKLWKWGDYTDCGIKGSWVFSFFHLEPVTESQSRRNG